MLLTLGAAVCPGSERVHVTGLLLRLDAGVGLKFLRGCGAPPPEGGRPSIIPDGGPLKGSFFC